MSGPYSVIYADPPWRYRCNAGQGAAENHYPTMSLDEIKALPVSDLAAQNCALFLWITCPMLNEAWAVLDAWGFAYKTAVFVWVKVNRQDYSLFTGLGWWTRANAELCLLATKGNPRRQSTFSLETKKRHDTRFLIWNMRYHASSFCRGFSPAASRSDGTRFTPINTLFASSSPPNGPSIIYKKHRFGQTAPLNSAVRPTGTCVQP